jgi:hypothetical protein
VRPTPAPTRTRADDVAAHLGERSAAVLQSRGYAGVLLDGGVTSTENQLRDAVLDGLSPLAAYEQFGRF